MSSPFSKKVTVVAEHRARIIGVLAAVFATFSWSLNFISPYALRGYTSLDFITVRFIFGGLLGVVLVFSRKNKLASIGGTDVVYAMILGLAGYAGYVYCIMGAVIFSGPVIPPAILGTVPVILVIFGNILQRKRIQNLPWLPLLLVFAGLCAVNIPPLLNGSYYKSINVYAGIAFSVLSVVLWVLFSVFNQIIFERKRDTDAVVWTGLMMVGAGVGVLAFYPVGLIGGASGLFLRAPGWNFVVFLTGAMSLAFFSSVAGAWAWNIASQRLPMVVTGQLISVETVFAIMLGLFFHRRMPAFFEVTGTIMLILGSVWAVRAFFKTPASP